MDRQIESIIIKTSVDRSINFFCIIGALNAGYICDKFGRRLTFTISCIVFIVGLLIQVVITGYVESTWKCVCALRLLRISI